MDQELVQYLDERFRSLEGRFQHIDERFQRQEQCFNARFDGIEPRFDRLDDRIDEVKRDTGVLVEGLRHEVNLLAEEFGVFVESRYAQDQANIAEQFRETRALIHLSYDQLRQRVEHLERKAPN